VLAGDGGPARSATLLGAAVILKAAGKALTLAEGVDLATAALDGGGAREVLAKLLELDK
jgi:anthranilate phosphoribosyltransferase